MSIPLLELSVVHVLSVTSGRVFLSSFISYELHFLSFSIIRITAQHAS